MTGRLLCGLLGVLVWGLVMAASACAGEPLRVGIAINGELGGAIVKAFMSRYPSVEVVWEAIPQQNLTAMLKPGRQQSEPRFDVLWLDNPMEAYRLKAGGLLYPYISPYVRQIVNPLQDYDGSFTAARFGVVGIVQRGEPRLKTSARWDALPESEHLTVALADPAGSDKAYLIAAHLREAFSRNFFRELFKHGGRLFKTTEEALGAAVTGAVDVALAVDIDVFRGRNETSALTIGYPRELILIPSPVAIVNNTSHLEMARKFVDFVLSPEGQELVAKWGTLPVLSGIPVPERFGLPSLEEAMTRAIETDYARLFATRQRVLDDVAEAVRAGGKAPRETGRDKGRRERRR